MNRVQGVATAGVVLLGAMLRPGAGVGTGLLQSQTEIKAETARRAKADVNVMLQPAERSVGDGPWLASCHYWEVVADQKRSASPAPEQTTTQDGAKEGNEEPVNAVSGSEDQSDCARKGDRWGIPAKSAQVDPKITAIIAAVPDPVHTHMALEYDRAIDSLMQSAAANGYLRSFFWMPWKSPNDGHGAEAGSAAETIEQRRREQQPGLIVLKRAPKLGELKKIPSYDEVIYLFVVGESPASGMNGTQLRNALRHEAALKALSKPIVGPAAASASVTTGATPTALSPLAKTPSVPAESRFQFQTSMLGGGDLAIIGSAASGAAISLREAVEGAPESLKISTVHAAGATETKVANEELSAAFAGWKKTVSYLSFGEDTAYEEDRTLHMAKHSGYDLRRFAILAEDGTVFGDQSKKLVHDKFGEALVIPFPRDISLLRNAQPKEKIAAGEPPSPYLRLTLKDPAVNDTIPHFSTEQTPLSQEAQLMSIQRQLLNYHAQFLAIYASNVLDEMFLANFLHRACPNMRLVFMGGGDLLLERDLDNAPYIGSLTVTPYNLVGLMRLPPTGPARAFPDSQSEALFNAASYIFHDHASDSTDPKNPVLAGYQEARQAMGKGESTPLSNATHASLWATVLGNDGYYPLGLVSHCASDTLQSLPTFQDGEAKVCAENATSTQGALPIEGELQQLEPSAKVYPSLLWTLLSIVLGLYCTGHLVLVLVAWYWSPFTRDVAIAEMAEPGRRSVYMNIGAVVLFLMALVLELPAFLLGPTFQLNATSLTIAYLTLTASSIALVVTIWKTGPYSWGRPPWAGNLEDTLDTRRAGYLLFNGAAMVALLGVTWAWWHICRINTVQTTAFGSMDTSYGAFFSYRCLHPDSEVSPAVPVLLVLLGWYLWAICQTYRLRFSEVNRPRLPRNPGGVLPAMYVNDETLDTLPNRVVNMKQSFHLYENISCLLITREVVSRFMADKRRWRTWASVGLAIAYILLFCAALNLRMIESVDRMLLAPGSWPTLYERLLAGLLAPLVFIALAGALRLVLVWGALRRGVLEPLDRLPLRMAFTRLKGLGWVAMMRDTGLHLRWKDMARTNEAIRQLLNHPDVKAIFAKASREIAIKAYGAQLDLNKHVLAVRKLAKGEPIAASETRLIITDSEGWNTDDLPVEADRLSLAGIYVIEKHFAWICEAVLEAVLIPYWIGKRHGFVASDAAEGAKVEDASQGDPEYIQLAEELLALRYVSLIRAVLGNVRYLMTFVAAVFVLSLVAWNSYPFQPRQIGDWIFTMVFVVLGTVTVGVFAQMHRDAILSRITDTKPNELGIDFYLRMASFGAIPLLTWLAYQFPSVGSGLFHILQPGLGALK